MLELLHPRRRAFPDIERKDAYRDVKGAGVIAVVRNRQLVLEQFLKKWKYREFAGDFDDGLGPVVPNGAFRFERLKAAVRLFVFHCHDGTYLTTWFRGTTSLQQVTDVAMLTAMLSSDYSDKYGELDFEPLVARYDDQRQG